MRENITDLLYLGLFMTPAGYCIVQYIRDLVCFIGN